MDSLKVRKSCDVDAKAILALYPEAFPEEELCPLVTELLVQKEIVLSLVAMLGEEILGHICFTVCGLTGQDEIVSLLGPVAVSANHQKKGVGSALIRDGFDRLKETGARRVLVLGDPGYYRRFGFVEENRITTPYPLPDEWRQGWQSVALDGDGSILEGTLDIPEPWRERALWAP